MYSLRLQETKTGSPVLMQEDTNRTLYKPQVYSITLTDMYIITQSHVQAIITCTYASTLISFIWPWTWVDTVSTMYWNVMLFQFL